MRTRRTVGECYALRPSVLREALGRLDADSRERAGYRLALTWSSKGRELASVGAQVLRLDGRAVELQLVYQVTIGDREPERITESIRLEAVPQRGATTGRRWWFGCPGCTRRCGVLYLRPDGIRFRCRTCAALTYRSCIESDKRISRAVRAIASGARFDVPGASPSQLGVMLAAYDVYRKRARRALRRDMGKRAYRRMFPWPDA